PFCERVSIRQAREVIRWIKPRHLSRPSQNCAACGKTWSGAGRLLTPSRSSNPERKCGLAPFTTSRTFSVSYKVQIADRVKADLASWGLPRATLIAVY